MPLGKDMTWIDAFFETQKRGGLPSNVLHDESIKNAGILETLRKIDYYAAWGRELIAYPAKYGTFAKGDIEDLKNHYWKLPARYVPKATVGKKGIALSIVPKDITQKGDATREIIPESVTILKDFPQTYGLYDFDEKTRMPIDKKPKGTDYWDARYLWRWDEQAICPVARFSYWYGDYRRNIDCGQRHPSDYHLGVGVVEPQRKLKLNHAEEIQVDETFRTKVQKDGLVKVQLPKRLKVKQGTSVEVNVKTL